VGKRNIKEVGMKRSWKIWRVTVILCMALSLWAAKPAVSETLKPVPISASEYDTLSASASSEDAANLAEIRSGDGLIIVLAVIGIVVIISAILKNKRMSEII
jgi:hypothetical protein